MVLPPLVYGHPAPRPLRVLVADDNPDTTDTLALLSRSLERWLHATLKVDREVRRLATIAGVPAPARERP